ncbi:MAG: hypothetical protein ACRBBP_05350 [Bdellovibrionales bacterium]
MKFSIKKSNLYFYSVLAIGFILITGFIQLNQSIKSDLSIVTGEKRVIKCEVPLNKEMIQNVYYVAESKQAAKQLLFNSKNGLFFDNSLYIKTTDFNGADHVVAFKDIHCDSVGTQVSMENSI